MQPNRPFSQAADNNKHPILAVLQRVFADRQCVLEVGSGTGQHSLHFAEHLPHLQWQPSDVELNHKAWYYETGLNNLRPPVAWDVRDPIPEAFRALNIDAIYSANTAHIMAWETTQTFIRQAGNLLPLGGGFALYGPFNQDGQYTSESNAAFDKHLKHNAPHQGIRDMEKVIAVGAQVSLALREVNPMPANNFLMVWQKV